MTDTLKSVVEDELQKAYERGVQEGRKAEREACAKVCEWEAAEWEFHTKTALNCAAAIRARGQK